MKSRLIIKICIDVAMTVALLLLMAYQLIGEEAHEWIGVIMFVLFVMHHLLNRAWSRNVLKGRYTTRRYIQDFLVLLILLCMIGSMISGVILSRYVFVPLNITRGAAAARNVHMLCAYWGFILMSIHLGFHWNMIVAMVTRAFPKAVAGSILVARIIAVLIAVYGGIAFVKRDFWNYMTLKNHFAFYDFSEPVLLFLLDYLAVMGLFVVLGHYVCRKLFHNGYAF